MRKKLTTFILGLSIMTIALPQTVFAAKDNSVNKSAVSRSADNGGDIFSDGRTPEGDMDAMANNLVKRTEEEAQKYKEEREAAKKAAEEKEAQRKAEEARRKAEEAARKAEEEKRKAEEAAKKAEEERLAKRQEVVDFALQFEGNPYVYGGTSLTNGADCSGFVMSVFKEFGYELPRVAADQCTAASAKEVKDIEPGDLVFYGDYGIDHVALYIGDAKIIHASTSATGIKISDYDYRQPTAVGTYMD
ncbi:C40 family peptidase [Blautia schinkii]|nr:C40 family peptidase [Blautia schinkii]